MQDAGAQAVVVWNHLSPADRTTPGKLCRVCSLGGGCMPSPPTSSRAAEHAFLFLPGRHSGYLFLLTSEQHQLGLRLVKSA